MLAVISPAKTLDFDTPLRLSRHSLPEFTDEAAELAAVMRRRQPEELMRLMNISDRLARLNVARYQAWSSDPAQHARQALFAFMGDVYSGLDARSLGARDLTQAQKRLRILSGLYGLLRPLDLIQAYRLEMGTALTTTRGPNLYRFWGLQPTAALNAQLRALGSPYLINLASAEYFRAVVLDALEAEVVTPVFKDWSNGTHKVVSFHAKRARGAMARYIIEQRPRRPAELKRFAADGYRFDETSSSATQLVFKRRQA
ncbi:MAG: peroxide stress protein YaaA [Gammaproteobacteria bacterium]